VPRACQRREAPPEWIHRRLIHLMCSVWRMPPDQRDRWLRRGRRTLQASLFEPFAAESAYIRGHHPRTPQTCPCCITMRDDGSLTPPGEVGPAHPCGDGQAGGVPDGRESPENRPGGPSRCQTTRDPCGVRSRPAPRHARVGAGRRPMHGVGPPRAPREGA
jgi:hypothetical protein